MNQSELIAQLKPYARIPSNCTWEDIPEPICPECHIGIDRIGISRLPAKYGKRGNPTLKCLACGKAWSYPALRKGGPIRHTEGLTQEMIELIETFKDRLGVDKTSVYLRRFGIPEECRIEVRVILDTTPEQRAELYKLVGSVAIETIAFHQGMTTAQVTALSRGHLYRKSLLS